MAGVKKSTNSAVDVMPKQKGLFTGLPERMFREKPLGVVGFFIVVVLFLTGIFADFIAPEKATENSPGYNIIHLADRFHPPSAKYPLGTDQLGRDILSRVIYGARLSMIVAVVATAIHTFVSVTIGLSCAYFGGKFDLLVQRFVDGWICFPPLIMLITLMAIIGSGMLQILLCLGIIGGISSSRFVRSLVFAIRENQYIFASEAIGATSGYVMLRHILPNIMPMVIVLFSINMGGMILTEASLSFLGLGLPPPYPSWGSMISGEGRANIISAPWIMLWPGLVLSLVVFGINMFGDAVRDLLDPRLRGGLGSYRLSHTEKIAEKRLRKIVEKKVGTEKRQTRSS